MEQRRMLTADPLLVGGVYTENDSGSDAQGDTFEISFVGGAQDTALTRLTIDGDQIANFQNTPGLSSGDVFFDIASGGRGVDNSFPFLLESVTDASGAVKSNVAATATVIDGGTLLAIDLSGVNAGDILTFSIDVDEAENVDPRLSPTQQNQLFDPLTSGAEFHGAMFTAHFSAPHYHDIQATGIFQNFYDPIATAESQAANGAQLNLPADAERLNPDRTAGVFAHVEQTPLPITIGGTVYHDRDRDLTQDVANGEEGISGVTIELWKLDTNGQYVAATTTGGTAIATQTNPNGDYEFDTSWNLLPGTYQLREQQPAAFAISVGAIPGTVSGAAVGNALNTDNLSTVAILLGGQHAVDYDFGEANPAAISGFVYHDRDNDGIREPGDNEEAIPSTTIQLRDASGQVAGTTTTNSAGYYEFTNLLPGTYSVFETQPTHWIDGKDTLGSVATATGNPGLGVASNDALETILLLSGDVGTQYNFGERTGSLAGRVHVDTNEDCLQDPGEISLQGVLITLQDQDGKTWTTTTDINGDYSFDDLLSGAYTVTQTQPTGYFNGQASVGSGSGQSTSANRMSGITIDDSHLDLVDYNFCEHVGSLSGFVYHDRDNDGRREPVAALPLPQSGGEEAIPNVSIALLNAQGVEVASAVTNANGFYKFDGLAPGTYSVIESHPGQWIDGKDTVGTLGGNVVNDQLSAITLVQDAANPALRNGEEYNFGERLGSLEGFVHSDPDLDCFFDQSEAPIAGVEIILTDQFGNTTTTVTDVNGRYRFDELFAGTYSVVQVQPSSFFSSGQVVGNGTGDASVANQLSGINIGGGDVDLVNYNFCEHLGAISGYVYHDRDNDGLREPGQNEEAIPSVELTLLDGAGNVVGTTTTDAQGFYLFDALPPEVYSVIETQPSGWIDGLDTPGLISGARVGSTTGNDDLRGIDLTSATLGTLYNFGELLPGSIAGMVHTDLNLNCLFEPQATFPQAQQQEIPLAEVSIELYDANGNFVATTTTDVGGNYRFDGLRPGEYKVVEIQPLDLFSIGEVVGSGAGAILAQNQLGAIQLSSGDHFDGYNFCEAPAATLSGFVFQDGPVIITADGSLPSNLTQIRDGALTPDDTRIAGVVLELRNGLDGAPIDASDALPGHHPSGPIQAVTDASGYYEFTGLPRGVYAVYQVHPNGYFDSLDTAGTTAGRPFNVNAPIPQSTLLNFAANPIPAFDAIISISIGYGQSSDLNNFSEVRTQPDIPDDPEDPPPRVTPPTPEAPRLVIRPPIIVAPPKTPPGIPIYGAAGVVHVTWHLSVVDAGAARGAGTARSTLWIHEGSDEVWRHNQLKDAQWILSSGSDDENPTTFEHLFGQHNAIPVTGDFDGNGTTEIGVYIQGEWFLDLNGNGRWDEEDLWLQLGTVVDQPVTGDWDGDGKDDIGIFGPMWVGDPRAIRHDPGLPDVDNVELTEPKNLPPTPEVATNGHRLMQKSVDGNVRADLIDHVFYYGKSGDVAIAGDWNGDGIDNIGIFRHGQWILDSNGDGRLTDKDETFELGESGALPVVMDANGDGIDDIGFYRHGEVWMDIDHNRELDAHDAVFELAGELDRVFTGDFDGDGTDEVGRYRAFGDDRQADAGDDTERR
jgi:serine-aspartate repeat-containing protein C/D/E